MLIKKGVFVFLPERFDEEHIVTDKTFFLSLLVIKLLALFQSFTLDSCRKITLHLKSLLSKFQQEISVTSRLQ